jgi:hypothetical protein
MSRSNTTGRTVHHIKPLKWLPWWRRCPLLWWLEKKYYPTPRSYAFRTIKMGGVWYDNRN